MKKTTLMVMMALCQAAYAAPALSAKESAAALELAKANGCLSCHALDEKIVGPAYSKVAAKYSDDKDAVASIAQSIRNGSQGKWAHTHAIARQHESRRHQSDLALGVDDQINALTSGSLFGPLIPGLGR